MRIKVDHSRRQVRVVILDTSRADTPKIDVDRLDSV